MKEIYIFVYFLSQDLLDKYDNYKDLVNENYYVVPIANKSFFLWYVTKTVMQYDQK